MTSYAATVIWTVNATGDLGQTLSGTFTYDASLGTNSGTSVTDVNLSLSGGSNASLNVTGITKAGASGTWDLVGRGENASWGAPPYGGIYLSLSWPGNGPYNSVLTDAGGTYDLVTTGGSASRMFWGNGNSISGFSYFTAGTITSPGVSAVPLPAGGALLLTGVAGFAALRRRKTRRAQV
jgi:hypothetical protein